MVTVATWSKHCSEINSDTAEASETGEQLWPINSGIQICTQCAHCIPSLETRNEPDTSEAMVGELYHLFSLLLSYSLNAPHVSFLVNNLTALINIDHLHLWSIYECWNPAATVLKMFKLSQYLFHLDHPRDYLICWSKSGQNTMEQWPPNPFVVTKPPHGFIRHQSPPSLLVCYLNFVHRGLSGGLLQARVKNPL